MIASLLAGRPSVLLLGAHADDIEIGCGGTIGRLVAADAEIEITWVVLSADGERAAEAVAGANAFIAEPSRKQVIVAEFRDSYFPAQYEELKSFLHDLAAGIDPGVIFTHRLEDRHQDHRLVAELTWNVFRNHLILEYEVPKYEGDLSTPNVYVPLTGDAGEHKVESIVDIFRSQHLSPDALWALLRLRGLESKAPDGLAEGFTGRKLVL